MAARRRISRALTRRLCRPSASLTTNPVPSQDRMPRLAQVSIYLLLLPSPLFFTAIINCIHTHYAHTTFIDADAPPHQSSTPQPTSPSVSRHPPLAGRWVASLQISTRGLYRKKHSSHTPHKRQTSYHHPQRQTSYYRKQAHTKIGNYKNPTSPHLICIGHRPRHESWSHDPRVDRKRN